MQEEDNKTFLGTGWAFPPAFDKISFTNEMVHDLEDIQQSIFIILSTTPGERIMQPEFGCYLKRLVFEKIESSLVNELNEIIKQSLLRFEPRVIFNNAEIISRTELDGILYLRIYYTVIITNSRHNMVFPFYKLEGTDIN